ncbi:MAG: NAD-dependent deacylase [Thermoplasmata archaeon]
MTKISEDLVGDILNSTRSTAVTGAGISVESDIAPFRGENGLWSEYDPNEYAHVSAFNRDPKKCWELFRLQIEEIFDAEPNAGHTGLVDLEDHGLNSVITQNIDGLHQRAGSRDVIELHGTLYELVCTSCGKKSVTEEHLGTVTDGDIPHCSCGSLLRPDVVLFGEQLPFAAIERARDEAENCDLMFVVGTSAVVQPAASLPILAKSHGAKVVEINLEETPLTHNISDYFIQGKAGETLPRLISRLQ